MGLAGVIAIVAFVAFWVVFVVAVLRFGPRRGQWNQPAAELRPPGRRTRIALYVTAAVHVVVGVVAALASPGTAFWRGTGLVIVALAAAVFYVACAECMRIAARIARRVDARRSGADA